MLATKKIQILKKCKTCNAILSQWKGGSNVIQSVTSNNIIECFVTHRVESSPKSSIEGVIFFFRASQ